MRPYRFLVVLTTAIILVVTASFASTYDKHTSGQNASVTDSAEAEASSDSVSKTTIATKSERGWGLAVVRVGVAVGKAVAKAVTIMAVTVLKTVVHMIVPGS